MIHSIGYAATANDVPLAPWSFERRPLRPTDIHIAIQFCGVCHSDLHTVRGDWGRTLYPCVPGHEIVGKVVAVGAEVSRYAVGDTVAVGCMVDSCRVCRSCQDGEEQFCDKGPVMTYAGKDRHDGSITQGGYADSIVVDEAFVLAVPSGLDLAGVAPLLCAGITTWSPLQHWKVSAGQKVGVVGLGGLGHMAVKFARALGAHVVLLTTSESKREDALRLGAHEVVLSHDKDAMKAHRNSFHFILDTVSAPHDINAYLSLLRQDATLCQVGLPPAPLSINVFQLTGKRRQLAGSFIGGIKETAGMLAFCAKHNIVSDVERIAIQDINQAYERLEKGEVKYRFVIDMASLKAVKNDE